MTFSFFFYRFFSVTSDADQERFRLTDGTFFVVTFIKHLSIIHTSLTRYGRIVSNYETDTLGAQRLHNHTCTSKLLDFRLARIVCTL